MDLQSPLETFAEIGVALAGFSALVSVLAGRTRRSDPTRDSYRLLVALECSLFVAAFSLLPLVPLAFGLPDALAWRGCAVVYLALDLTFSMAIGRRARKLEMPVVEPRWLSTLIWSFSALGQVALAVAALGLVRSATAPLYLFALFLNVVNAGLAFMNVAWRTFVPDEPGSIGEPD